MTQPEGLLDLLFALAIVHDGAFVECRACGATTHGHSCELRHVPECKYLAMVRKLKGHKSM